MIDTDFLATNLLIYTYIIKNKEQRIWLSLQWVKNELN